MAVFHTTSGWTFICWFMPCLPIYCLSACFLARFIQVIKFLPIKGTVLDLIKARGMVATASTHLCGVTA